MTTKLFVYGSLMKGLGNHHQLAGSKFLYRARTEMGYELVDLGAFPGMVPGAGVVHGEVYEVDDGTLARLDRFEGCPTFYRRSRVQVSPGLFTLEAVDTYLLVSRGNRPTIASGKWRVRGDASTAIELEDGRTYCGTPVEIVRAMKARAIFGSGQSLTEYVAAVVERAEMMGTTLRVSGSSEGDVARSLVHEMLRTGLAR